MDLIIILLGMVAFIVIGSSKFKIHPFITLMTAAVAGGIAFRLPLLDVKEDGEVTSQGVVSVISSGFGGLLGGIGLVIIFGTIIGVILEKSGAAITIADGIVKLLGNRFPTLTMTIIGFFVSIPVFCDSGFVILNSLKESMSKRMSTSPVAMSVALATGLYATHTFVPPTPGPIAAAGNLGLEGNLGLVILVGLPVAIITALAGNLWARRFSKATPEGESTEDFEAQMAAFENQKEELGTLPSSFMALAPIGLPVLLIMLGSIANFPSKPLGTGELFTIVAFMGTPLVALLCGLVVSLGLIKGNLASTFNERIVAGITAAAPILLITGAGGSFGAVIKATDVGDYLGTSLSDLGVGIFMPFLVAAALKSAQGSSTVALVATSALVEPLLGDLGLSSEMGRVLTVMAIGSGAMTVSHANDSFFWVVTQFSRMSVGQAYRAQTLATLIQGITGIALVFGLSLVLL